MPTTPDQLKFREYDYGVGIETFDNTRGTPLIPTKLKPPQQSIQSTNPTIRPSRTAAHSIDTEQLGPEYYDDGENL